MIHSPTYSLSPSMGFYNYSKSSPEVLAPSSYASVHSTQGAMLHPTLQYGTHRVLLGGY